MGKSISYSHQYSKKSFTLSAVIVLISIAFIIVFILIINKSDDSDVLSSSSSSPSPPPSLPSSLSQEDKPVDLSEDMRFCNSASDCVPVDCGCSCSGCGGFSYQDVVNSIHVNSWYEQHNCKKPEICPQVCCPKRKVACENHVCVVIE